MCCNKTHIFYHNDVDAVAQFTNFLWGNIFYGIGESFFALSCPEVMPKAPYQHPLLKSIHVLKSTKAWYACTYIEHWINETNEKNGNLGGGGDGPPASPPLPNWRHCVVDDNSTILMSY